MKAVFSLEKKIIGNIQNVMISRCFRFAEGDYVACVALACVAGVQRGGRGEVECEREARSLSARRERLP